MPEFTTPGEIIQASLKEFPEAARLLLLAIPPYDKIFGLSAATLLFCCVDMMGSLLRAARRPVAFGDEHVSLTHDSHHVYVLNSSYFANTLQDVPFERALLDDLYKSVRCLLVHNGLIAPGATLHGGRLSNFAIARTPSGIEIGLVNLQEACVTAASRLSSEIAELLKESSLPVTWSRREVATGAIPLILSFGSANATSVPPGSPGLSGST